MARCGPVSAMVDGTDPVLTVRGACIVHRHYAPCPLDGEPAVAAPLHLDCRPTVEATVADWSAKTLRQRPALVHMASWLDLGPDGQEHVVDDDILDCWCGPVLFPAEVLA